MAATFSYAQAAKGVSSPASVSKPTSGSATPAKDTSKAALTSVASVGNWADDAETDSATEQPTAASETQSQKPSSKPAVPSQSVDVSDASTPDIDALSSSTAAKDDDVSSQPNMSSESTWDNKSQASTSVDKSVEPVEKTSEKTKKAKSAPAKPLKEAPLPTVNVWQQRADEQKTKAKPTPAPAVNGTSNGSAAKKSNADGNKSASNRKDTRETEKKGAKGRPSEREVKVAPTALPLPPDRDQESWPTPDTAIDEDRKKAQEKTEKERKDSAPNGASSKQEWVKVPYTPSVVFNTPLPNAAGSRRGGRPGGRGGAQTGGRSAGISTNGAGQAEKDGSASDAVVNGEQTKRTEGAATGDLSPQSKRAGNATSPGSKDQATAVNGEKSKGPTAAPFEPETQSKRGSATADASQTPNQNGTFPRQYPNKPGKGRRGDFSGAGERRRDGAASPTKDGLEGRPNGTDGQGENERRAFDGPNGHPSKQNRYSYSGGRDRPRGGGRGGRGGFSNGHQFANGHPHSQQSSSSFSLGPRSPTTFNPENSTFFPAPQGGKYGRNGHRSQSVADSYRYPPYQSGPPLAPLQTFNMYDYNIVQPMSAVPYNPYGVDQFALFSMITIQV
jgi:la-related protein 1